MKVPFSYLDRQFADVDPYLDDIRALVKSGDFTLGKAVAEFETRFAEHCGMPCGIGVGSGTDALALSLKALGVGPGDEVVAPSMTFIATAGAIAMTGAKPVFVDSEEGFVIDPAKIEPAITERTKAIVPVHYTGNVADMPAVLQIARKHNLAVVEDACQAIGASIDGAPVGSWGEAACFSLHPLKNLNVWGDAGIIVTRSAELAEHLRLLRNHGLIHRDEAAIFGHNSRLDSLQALVGNRLIDEMNGITERRIKIARRYDVAFAHLEGVSVPQRRGGVRHVFHLYVVRARERDALLRHLHERGVEAKIHYPLPLHLMQVGRDLGYRAGDFPQCEADCKAIVTLPAHQHLSDDEADFVIDTVRGFYR
ncbi:MAG: DegT/DnrJ/EryC1/StrS family aminotransferase [Planctomycetaceae bacterium]